MSISTELLEGWKFAAHLPLSKDLRSYPLESAPGIFACIDAEGQFCLLVELNGDESVGARVSGIDAGIACSVFQFLRESRNRRGMLLTCHVPDVTEAFAAFGETLVEHRRAGATANAAFRQAYADFRKLLTSRLADLSVLVGLLGELVTLERLIAKSKGALSTWMYPDLERHDFRRGDVALEVKTALRSMQGAAVVSISAIDQLEPPAHGVLYLRYVQLERDPEGPVSVSSFLDRIAAQIASDDALTLRESIEHAGLSTSQCAERFSVKQFVTYLVSEDFPRLTPSRLADGRLDEGVRRVRYELDLGSALRFQLPHDDAEAALLAGLP